MQPKRFSVWVDLLAVVLIFLAATLVSIFCGASMMIAAPTLEFIRMATVIYAVQFSLAIGGVCIYYSKRPNGEEERGPLLRFSFNWYNAPLTLWGIVLITAASLVMEPVLNLFPAHYFEQLGKMLGGGGWAIVLTVILAPICEELFFRGLVLEQFARRWGTWRAVAVSALFFGLVHLPNLPQAVNAIVMGVVLGYIYVATRSLTPVILIHAINNGIAYLLLEMTGTQNTDTRTMIGNDTLYWALFGASAATLAVSLVLMWYFARRKDTKTDKTPLKDEIKQNEQPI